MNMRKPWTASLMAGWSMRANKHCRRLGIVAALLWIGLAPSATAAVSIGAGGGSAGASNSGGQAGTSTQIGGSPISNVPPATYTTNLGALIGLDVVLSGLSTVGSDQFLADILRLMRDTGPTGSTTPRPAPQINTLLAFIATPLECKQGNVSCSSNMFVPGEFASGVYAVVIAGCAQSPDPNICVSRLGQIDLSCTATVASVCSAPGVPVVTDLFASATSVLEVQSYSNGALRVFVPAPVAPGGGGVSPEMPSAVPEPATWAMMLVGFGMVGATARYRRRRTSVVYA